MHLLWALVWIKVFVTELVLCSLIGWPTSKPFREKDFHIVEYIVDLKPKFIKASNRFIGTQRNWKCLSLSTSACTDIKTEEPWPFNKSMCSKNFNRPGFKYDVTLAVFSDNICSSSGPFPTGYSEGRAFIEGFGLIIPDNEPCKVDAGVKEDV